MADEQAKEEVETSAEQPETEQPSEEVDASEGDKTPTETDKGDLNIALKQERDKRRELESLQNDPNFIYSKAQELGMTETEQATQPIDQQPIQQQPMQNSYELMDDFYGYKKEVEKFPQAETDPDIAGMVNGLVQQGKKPAEAVKVIKRRFDKAVEEAKLEETKQQETEKSEQNKAQTATSDVSTTSDAEEMAELRTKSKSTDPTVQKYAMIELLKRKNKAEGII